MKNIIAVLILWILTLNISIAKSEKDYQTEWCKHEVEYRLEDKTRVDCLTPDFAIEFDFGHKWAEAIGQSLHYSIQTDRRPGIVLILLKQSDEKYYKRMQDIIWNYRLPIQTWVIKDY